ncbi:MAG: tRNA 2-selenouridine(34) synthase MnmH [Quisquiliibacterium sp.]
MKNAEVLTVDQAIERLDAFDLILDARSPAEFAQDHLPGARSTPVLDDEQRARVGTLYKQVGAFEAKRIGAALVARNIAEALDGPLADLPRDARLLVYCWRGGNRSGALATVLARVGWRTALLDGGYRAFRRHVLDALRTLPGGLRLIVIAGRTGSGKSLILERLATLGAQVLDLEKLARHRGSVLGHLPDNPQPSQKRFESMLWDTLRGFDPTRPVFVESESRKVGQCQVPAELIEAMRRAPCIRIEASDAARCELLLAEYRHFVQNPEHLAHRLEALIDHHGKARVDDWIAKARAGEWESFVLDLLHQHYDPAYDRSMTRNYRHVEESRVVTLTDTSDSALIDAARAVLETSRG